MRIALLQIDSTVGDLAGNASLIAAAAVDAHAQGSHLAVTPELAICGYPPRDLLLREGFVDACEQACDRLAAQLKDRGAGELVLAVGMPIKVSGKSRPIGNGVAIIRAGRVEATYCKQLLPHYDVFDEARYFAPGSSPLSIDVAGERVAVLICEDMWRGEELGQAGAYREDPLLQCAAAGATLAIVPSASPFFAGKQARRLGLLRQRAMKSGVSIASVNAAGANDDFVFDGGSCLTFPSGEQIEAARFRSDTIVIDMGSPKARCARPQQGQDADFAQEAACAIISAIGGYVRKSGHERVLIGLSGGIDSAVVAALAVAALGPDRVRGVSMPSEYSSPGSIADARKSAQLLGMNPPDQLPIGKIHSLMAKHFGSVVPVAGLTDENLQSRIRGLTLMTLSNATGALVLSTGNKSELAVGYATLYGDMCGGLAPLGDLLKTQVYEVARWLNSHHDSVGLSAPPVPEESIDKAPSAELRAGQTDQDSLPPYEVLDRIVHGWVDLELSAGQISLAESLPLELVMRWTSAIDRAQFKRFQSPLIPKLSARAFGPGRRVPLAMRYRLGDG